MSSGPRQLTSWKEIAHYLGVNIRTAQRWERERGLPVRRVPGARSRVSTDTATLDVWKQELVYSGKPKDCCYCWPLGQGLMVEVRFLGPDLRPTHVDLLREYLNLVKTALSTSAGH